MHPNPSPTIRPRGRGLALVVASALALGAAAVPSLAVLAQDEAMAADVTAVSGDLGTYLVDADGLTLYYFQPDAPGMSACEGDCLANWPALAPDEDGLSAGEGVSGWLSSFTRADGTEQAAYRGRPLYTFVGDEAAGDTNGHGLNDVWWVASEDGSLPNATPPESPELTLEAVESELGTYITAADGLTAYFFTVDTVPGVSMCEGDCLTAWPPVSVSDGGTVAAGEGVVGVVATITATDGSTQVTYDGRPLYYFQGDQVAGDTNGQGVADVWFVASVDGQIHAMAAEEEMAEEAEPAADGY